MSTKTIHIIYNLDDEEEKKEYDLFVKNAKFHKRTLPMEAKHLISMNQKCPSELKN